MSTINAVPFRSTIFYTAAGVPAATGSVLTIGSNGVGGFTTNLGSTMVSIGASTNQTYNNFTNGLYTNTLWGSTLTGLSAITDVVMTPNGQYQLAVQNGSSTIRTSANSGLTWSSLTGANGLPAGATAYPQATASGTPNYTNISVSATGQYQLASVSGGLLYVCANGTSASPTFTAAGMGAPNIYLPMENSVTDVVGSSAPVATGTPAYVTGIVGSYAINLANTPAGGTATRYVRGTWSGASSLTVSFWMNPQTISSVYQYIFSMYSGAIQIFISNTNVLNCVFPTGTTTGQTVISTTYTASVNTWYHLAAIFQTGGICSFYVNNVLVGTMTNAGGFGTFTQNNTFGLGTYDNAQTNCFNGYIDDVRLYNSAITYSPIVPANWAYTAVSATGQYMLAAANGGGLFQSSNYGATWIQVNAVLNGGVWNSLSISASGQYALATTSTVTIQPNAASVAANIWSVNGVTWTASASSVYLNAAYYLFNTATDNWASSLNTYNSTTGLYAGSTTTVTQNVGTISGEWFQIQSSVPLVASSYSYIPFNMACTAKTYYILGSNDGATWYAIQSASYGATNPCTNGTTQTTPIIMNSSGVQTVVAGATGSLTTVAYATTTTAYTYFRLVGTTTWTGSPAAFLQYGEFYINFVGGLTYTTNYGQTWSNNYFLGTAESFNALSGSGQYALTGTGQTAYLVSNYLGGLSTASYAIAPYNPAILSNLVYFPMNDAVGSTSAADTIYGYSAAVSGTVTFGATGKAGTAATFGGSGHLSLHPSVYSTWNNLTAGTISCWVYPTNNSSLTGSVLFTKQTNGVSTVSQLSIGQYAATTGTAGRVYFSMAHTLFNANCGSTTILALNTWYHIVVTFDGTNVRFYINGALDNTFATSWALPNNSSPTNITIGANSDGVTRYTPFTGTIDEFSLWNTALPLATVQSMYNGGNPVTPPNIIVSASSQTGQYMVIITQGTTNNVYYSINYGASWTALTIGSTTLTSCAISADGSYITVSNATTVYTLNRNTQGFSVSVGNQAGLTNQGQNTIAIGDKAGLVNQTANSIILNSSGSAVNSYSQGFYVAPIAQAFQSSALTFPLVGYGSDNQIVQSATQFSNSQSVVYGEWIQYQLATASPITSYTLQGRAAQMIRYPVSWIIVGSNDATTWTLLDTQTGTAGWGTYTLKATTAAYTYYRIVITQVTSNSLINISGWILNNGTPLFGASANYTIVASGLYNVLQYNGATVCTTTFSWPNTGVANSLGITSDATASASFPPGLLPTSDGYTKTNAYFLGFAVTAGAAYEYNASYIAVQGTSTTITTTVMGDTNMAGTLCIMNNSRVGIGSTNPQYSLDVLGTTQINGVVPGFGQPDSTALPQNAYATFGQQWNVVTGLSTNVNWSGSAMSATGQYQTVTVSGTNSGNNIYYSTNYGANWTLATGFLANANYSKGATSGSGQYQLVGISSTSTALYVSSNYGQTWSATSYTIGASSFARSSCLSYNGQYQFNVQAGSGTGRVTVSSNYGATFANSSAPAGEWWGVCCSSTGQYVSACAAVGYIWYSTNYGSTWTQSLSISASWIAMCCSASGQYQMAVINGAGSIYYSNDYGVNWTQSNAPAVNWGSISCTSTGQYVIANTNGNYIYYSTNYGMTWTQSGSISTSWTTCVISQNGLYALACVSGTGAVYSSQLANIGLVTNGRVGIGIATPNAPLHFANTIANRRIILWEEANNDHQYYGVGINPYMLRHQVSNTGSSHAFYAATSATTSNELMRISGNGTVGIGVTTPAAILSVLFDGAGVYNTATWNSGGWAVFGPGAGVTSGINSSAVGITFNTANNYGSLISLAPSYAWKRMYYAALDHYFIVNGTQAGYVNSTGFVNGSDEREKINIKNVNTEKSLERILACTPKTFQRVMDRTDPMISDEVKNKWHIGLIAQEVLSINPHCISEWTNQDGEARYGINYTDFVTHLIGSVKEIVKQSTSQAETIQTHEATIAALTATCAALQARMEALEARLT